MQAENLIPARTFCKFHQVDYSFLSSLQQSGLIEIRKIKTTTYLRADELHKLEKMVRLHVELDINIAGIEAVFHLLQQVEEMQSEMQTLKNRLRIFR